MLDALKKWFSPNASSHERWGALVTWAESRHFTFRGVGGGEGFVVDGRLGAAAWRLEWGPSQRSYVSGQELRIRAELSLPPDLQALVLNRSLQETMERDVFEQYVEDVQTRIDSHTPPEMRWLVMYPKLTGAELKGLRDRWAGISNLKPWLEHWLAGPLAEDLAATPAAPTDPVVLMIARGRLTLRTGVPEPTEAVLEGWLHLFESAMREAAAIANDFVDASSPSTQPSLWSPSVLSAATDAAHAAR